MKINIVCVGKIKEKFFIDAINEYKKRLSKFCNFKIIEVDEASKIENLAKKSEAEGKLILDACKGSKVALDICGTLVASTDIANFISKKQLSGISEISFIIGGSNGLSDEVKKASDFVMSFGNVTFPHQLFRVILTEQIYRAFTIIEGLPYHK